MDDSFLVEQSVKGNKNAFKLLVIRYQRIVFCFLGKFLFQPQLLEDFAQETFLRAYRNIAGFDVEKGASFSTWLITIARNLALNKKAKKNTGKKAWNEKTRISLISNPIIKKSFIIGTSKINEKQVSPGEIGTFKITIQSKLYGGFNYIKLRPNFNGEHLSEDAISIPTMVKDPTFDYEVLALSMPKKSVTLGESLTAIVTLKNTGNVRWRNYGIHRISLGSANPIDRESEFTGSTRMGFNLLSLIARIEAI